MDSVAFDTMAGGSLAAEPKKLYPLFAIPKTNHHHSGTSPMTVILSPKDTENQCTDSPGEQKIEDSQAKNNHALIGRKRKSTDEGGEDWVNTKKLKRGKKKAAITKKGGSIKNHFQKFNEPDIEPTIPEEQMESPRPAVNLGITAALDGLIGYQDMILLEKEAASWDVTKAAGAQSPSRASAQFNPKIGTIEGPSKPKGIRDSKTCTKSKWAKIQEKDTPRKLGEGGLQDQSENILQAQAQAQEQIDSVDQDQRRSKRVTVVKYGKDMASKNRFGATINEILRSSVAVSSSSLRRLRGRLRGSSKMHQDSQVVDETRSDLGLPKKITHPFFTGKAKPATTAFTTSNEASEEAPGPAEAAKTKPSSPTRMRLKIFSSTPCSPRRRKPTATAVPLPPFGVKSLGLKTPGSRLPAWPPKGMVHIRGDDDTNLSVKNSRQLLPARKSKGNTTNILQDESVLHNFALKLRIPETVDAIQNIDAGSFLPPPPELRLPKKHFESGVKLEKRVMRQVKNHQHPALVPLKDLVVRQLSAFDRHECESVCWAQKYTPKSAVEVLQLGKEVFLLRDWLETFRIQSVDSGEAKSKATKPPKRKRKKIKLDDFIADSSEEADEMDEVSNPEEDCIADRRGVRKSVIRAGDTAAKDGKAYTRLTNTVVISGPHGCGKTATVYALAKELGFEVFEVNPGSRRSGKDILEKIGDMTTNHLVQHHQTEVASATINDEEVAEDIKSGKQTTMNAFFQQKAGAKIMQSKPVKKAPPLPAKSEPSKSVPNSAVKNQKQSLILLDEVDIMYEEDKQFWTTVIGLIAQSKRPFVMTCDEENLIPLNILNLHGIFRLSAPPADLAVDRLLLIAACEGHALQRKAVEALYRARQGDMRACLMDLNYWCQVAVGDQRGGVDWFYPRWPKGCDVDADGNVVRVISQDTYVKGMGWLAHRDADNRDGRKIEEELMQEAYAFWDLDVGDWHETLSFTPTAGMDVDVDVDEEDYNFMFARIGSAKLGEYEKYTDAMSIAELTSTMAFIATPFEEPIDCSLPEVTDQKRGDYILGRQLLDAPVQETFDALATSLPIALRSLARDLLLSSAPTSFAGCLQPLDEGMVVNHIIRDRVESADVVCLTRDDFSKALNTLAASEKGNNTTTYFDLSILDGPMQVVALDIAPHVRGIVAYEQDLREQRRKLSILQSNGGQKRMRNTRASHAALEGGLRSTTRRERWFQSDLNSCLVMRTAGKGWQDALKEVTSSAEDETVAPT